MRRIVECLEHKRIQSEKEYRTGKEPLSAPSVIFHTTVVGSIGPLASYERILELPTSIESGAPTIVILISVLPAVANASSGFKT